MTVRCWRLLAIFSLIFLGTSPLLGQAPVEDHSPPGAAVSGVDRNPRLELDLHLPAPPDLEPQWMIRPTGPRTSPVGPIAIGSQQNILQQLVRSAGLIFTGRVISVSAGSSGEPERSATAITFQIEHALLGTAAGKVITIREWGGLWNRGERYRAGERVLLFLYAPSKLGFTSPVSGTFGRFAVNSHDQVEMSGVHASNWAGAGTFPNQATISYSDFALALQKFQRGTR
jgi:hypothetical protein